MAEPNWTEVKAELTRAGLRCEEIEPSRVVSVEAGRHPFILELISDGRLVALFGMDMDELRVLVSGDATEDLSEDELQRVARDNLRPAVNVYKPFFLLKGFEEGVDTGEGYYAIAFTKKLDLADPASVAGGIQDLVNGLPRAK